MHSCMTSPVGCTSVSLTNPLSLFLDTEDVQYNNLYQVFVDSGKTFYTPSLNTYIQALQGRAVFLLVAYYAGLLDNLLQ